MEADFVPCPSPTLPSSSLAYSPPLFSPSSRASVSLVQSVGAPFPFLNARLSVFLQAKFSQGTLSRAWPRVWASAREPQRGGSRALVAGGFLTGAKFLSVLETPKEATPEPWAEGQATEGVRSSSAARVPGWPLASWRQELRPGDQPRGCVRPSQTLVVIYKRQLDSSDGDRVQSTGLSFHTACASEKTRV